MRMRTISNLESRRKLRDDCTVEEIGLMGSTGWVSEEGAKEDCELGWDCNNIISEEVRFRQRNMREGISNRRRKELRNGDGNLR